MRRKRRRKISIGKSAIILTSIIMLNFVGVSYAAWTDSLQVNTNITTGKIEPVFIEGGSEATKIDINKTISLENEESTQKIFLEVKNNGTIPVMADEVNEDMDGLNINIDSHIIKPGDTENVQVTITVDETKDHEDSNYNLEDIKIHYKQFNDK